MKEWHVFLIVWTLVTVAGLFLLAASWLFFYGD